MGKNVDDHVSNLGELFTGLRNIQVNFLDHVISVEGVLHCEGF